MRKLFVLFLMLALAGCGGGGSGGGDVDGNVIDSAPVLLNLDVSIDGRLYRRDSSPISIEVIDDDNIIIAATPIAFEIKVENPDPSLDCSVAGTQMQVDDSNTLYTAVIQAAYFKEQVSIECSLDHVVLMDHEVSIFASDPILEIFFQEFLENKNYVSVSDDPMSEDPYSGYRKTNYYSDINRLISLAELYQNAVLYGLEFDILQKIEQDLINTSEAFFEPCIKYDLNGEAAAQCRSVSREGPYYIWRSPTLKDRVKLNHAKVEWRAAAGVAQAIKALLLNNPPSQREICPSSNEPSVIKNASLACRALNVRRLLYEEVWIKWNDSDWISSVGVASNLSISTTVVPHYIAWIEYIVDLFVQTVHIDADYECGECVSELDFESRRDFLFDYFFTYGDNNEYVGHYSEHPELGIPRIWEGYDFSVTNSTDISHSNTTIHLLSMYGETEACDSEGITCLNFPALARTMDEKAWEGSIQNDGFANGFPKFGVFINGYCSTAYENPEDSLYEFCNDYWVTESERWLPHRRLIGFVNLGRHNRDLMIKIRQASDNNRDGLLNNSYDVNVNSYLVFLYKALLNSP
jgi:hypothetical protein